MLLANLSRVNETVFLEFSFIHFENWAVCFVFIIDIISAIFVISVRVIRIAVLKFRQSYMSNDKYFIRFHLLIILFVSSMYLLILSPNLVRILLGWDGLGLTSYLLVIYYSSPKSFNSGIITALSNRIGDILILIRIGYVSAFGNWSMHFYINKEVSLILGIIILIAASTKSAQIPFSAWLPAAIAAPTPVSSLVHSSTLVTAGVYLVIRHHEFFFLNDSSSYLIVMGVLTITLARLSALFEIDLKKIIALSTLRQLGIIMLSLGLGAYLISFFHLLAHAFFKALLFVSAGAVIHNSRDYQDLRFVGRRAKSLPVTNSFILIASMSLLGVPFMSAFFSKEIILDLLLIENFNLRVYVMMIFGIFLTAAYSSRFVMFIFCRPSHGAPLVFKTEEDTLVTKGIFFLFLPAVLTGFWGSFLLWEVTIIRSSLFRFKIMILIIMLLGVLTYINKITTSYLRSWPAKFWRLSRIWGMPFIRRQIPVRRVTSVRNTAAKFFDRGILVKAISLVNLSFSQIKAYTISAKMIFKLLALGAVWGFVTILYYLCTINTIR